MRKLIDFLAPVGLAVMAGGAIAARQGYAVSPNLNTYIYGGLALVLLEVLEVADLHDAVAGHDPQDGEEPDDRAHHDEVDPRQRQGSETCEHGVEHGV